MLTSDGPMAYAVGDEPETWCGWPISPPSSSTSLNGGRSADARTRRGDRARSTVGEPLADRVVVDLDPGEGMTIVDVARAA